MAKNISLQIKGLTQLRRKFRNAPHTAIKIATNEVKKEIIKNIRPFSKSGKLAASFKTRINTTNNGQVYSNLIYSRIQDLGGKIRITDRMRRKMWALYKETGKSVYKAIALTKQTYVTLPAKNYTDIDVTKITKLIERKIADLLNN